VKAGCFLGEDKLDIFLLDKSTSHKIVLHV